MIAIYMYKHTIYMYMVVIYKYIHTIYMYIYGAMRKTRRHGIELHTEKYFQNLVESTGIRLYIPFSDLFIRKAEFCLVTNQMVYTI